jgi:hydrogenase maturation factor
MTCGPHDPHCITCSDEAVAMRVVEVHDDGLALCDDGSTIETALVEAVERGDVLLVHAGTAIARAA